MIKRFAQHSYFLRAAISLVWATRIITFLAFPNPVSAPDSVSYYSGKLFDFHLVSLTGHAGRGWVVPAIFSAMPNPQVLEMSQLAISGLSWTYLIFSIHNSQILTKKFSNAALLVLSIIGSSAEIVQHDSTILATSITNSLFIFCLALILKNLKLSKTVVLNFTFLILTVFLLSVQKSTFLPIAIFLFLIFRISNRELLSKKVKLVSTLISLILLILSFTIGSNVNKSWPVSYSGQTLLWQLGGQSPVAADFRDFLAQKGAPKCITEEAPYENLDVSIGVVLNNCPEGSAYIRSTLQREFVNFAVSHPTAPIKLAVFGIGAAITNSSSNYGNAVSIVPRSISEIFFGGSTPDIVNSKVGDQVAGMNFLKSNQAMWLFTPLLIWLLFAFIGNIGLHRRSRESSTLILLLLLCLAQSVLVVVLLPSEWVRQTSPFMIGALITSVLLCIKGFENFYETTASRDK